MFLLNAPLELSSETDAVNLCVTTKAELLKFIDCYFTLTVYVMIFLRKITEAEYCSREKRIHLKGKRFFA